MFQKLFFIAVVFCRRNSAFPDTHTLHVGALFEITDHFYDEYVNFFDDVITNAFEETRNRTDMLSDYALNLITKDTKVIKQIYR